MAISNGILLIPNQKCLLLLKISELYFNYFIFGTSLLKTFFPLYKTYHRAMNRENTLGHTDIKAISSAAVLASKLYVGTLNVSFV